MTILDQCEYDNEAYLLSKILDENKFSKKDLDEINVDKFLYLLSHNIKSDQAIIKHYVERIDKFCFVLDSIIEFKNENLLQWS